MAQHPIDIDAIFLAALDKPHGGERDRFLDEACRGDDKLRGRVARLLQAQAGAGSFLEAPAAEALATDVPITERTGDTIGPYKLLQQIGEGGMGVVYMAEQTEPVERRVALKIIKPGMDTRQVIARFEAERQALAMMDHPNIAKVLDAGTTNVVRSLRDRDPNVVASLRDADPPEPGAGSRSGPPTMADPGRPYFVMELVKGLPITQYCDEQHLTPRERLELFLPICQAVQHAHQKGVIHRDLKPSNILVARYDDKSVPKIIDFGVAKAVSQRLTERTMFTQYGQIVGTIEYMSPEQAQFNQLDVDTRSDIYSLGVLLYELLTGETPFDKQRLRTAAFDELLRIIREEEPPRPSTRLSSSETLPSIAANRHTEPKKLTTLVRGELDWIVMKALEKDRARRYETANGFAMDVQRYLSDEQVLACPPSAAYRLRKFVRRNKGRLVVAGVLAVALLVAIGGIGWAVRDRSAREAEAARQRGERQAKAGAQVESIFAEVDRLENEQKWPEALAAARRAEAVVAGGEADAATAERVREWLKDLEFIDRLEQIRMRRAMPGEGEIGDQTHLDREYAQAFREYGADLESLPIEQSIDRLKARPALAMAVAAALHEWANVRVETTSDKFANAFSKRLIAIARGIDPDPLRDWLRSNWDKPVSADELRRAVEALDMHAHRPSTLHNFAQWLATIDQNAAIKFRRDAQRVHPEDFWLALTLAYQLQLQKDFEGAARFYTAAISIRPQAIPALTNLGIILREQKKLDEAVATYRRALEIDPKVANIHINLGVALQDQNKLDEAVAAFRKAIELDPKVASTYSNLGGALADQKKLDEAVAACREAIELDPKFSKAQNNLGKALLAQEKLDEAVAAYRKAIELDGKNASAYNGLGVALRAQGKLDQAVAAYNKAIELDPKDSTAYINLGNALGDQKKPDEAIAAFSTAIKLDPTNARAYSGLGIVLGRLGDHAKAGECFRKAGELDQTNAIAYLNLGNTILYQKKWDEAVAAFRKAIELNPKNAWAFIGVGDALFPQGKFNEAVAAYNQALAIDPQHARAHNSLAWLLATAPDAKVRDPARAVELANRAVKLAPQEGAYWNTLGAAHYRAGDWEAAIAALEKSMEFRMGGDSSDWFFLGMAHWQLAEKDKAREWYDRAAKWMEENQPDNEELRRFRAEAAQLMKTESGVRDQESANQASQPDSRSLTPKQKRPVRP